MFAHPELRVLDKRSRTAAAIWAVRQRIIADKGGEAVISAAEMIVVERAACLSVWTDSIAARWAEGEAVDLNAYCTAVNTLNRTLASIGLKRVAKDVTPGFHDLIRQRAREKAEEAPAA
jgi:hypothetical protein